MKVREIITLRGWQDGSGWSYKETYSDKIVEIADPNSIDWSWWESQTMRAGEDIKIIVEFYSLEGEPIAKHETWVSEIQK